jgi:uncharacterized RDD family membrane protein YckC
MFCTWCDAYIPVPAAGMKAGIFNRWLASAIDPAVILLAVFLPPMVAGGVLGGTFGVLLILPTVLLVLTVFYRLFVQGMTPGKYILGLQVVDRVSGRNPGLAKMLVHEVVGKFVSGLFFGLGFFSAIWDKDSQAWHDKIAGTVVVKRQAVATSVPAQA